MTAIVSPLPLQEGANNPNVNMVQYFLQTLKLYSEPIDGVFGSKTKEAVLKFQAANGLSQDGIVGVNTAIALDNEAWAVQQDLLEEGFAGEGVKGFQEMYNSYFGTLAVDGVFGPKTKAEVIKFQKSRGLTADGVVGAKTWSSLRSLTTHDIPTDQRISAIFNVSDC
ncbi:putative peptidoglycan-binding domain-containing protein [Rivularia sp. PCC 7116]|uniref:peptidoglycan-binding domain-containing protein n=1 Tax=Rivularia sp. PCC 7116 TaxID=373994 RepID=UPI00029F09E3|nr:peptidoglycan-binding protein [Rivularia sp. PCC 7116]AFY54184.1 putative peptidoglycan-binding domain-containing protein [Rivularia sp. PCC 7116]